MADQPIDTSARPSMTSVQCGGPDCGQWIVVDRAYDGVGYCSGCLHAKLGGTDHPRVDPPPEWFSEHNPPPPFAVYPPGADIAGVRIGDPDVAGRCLAHPLDDPAGDLHLMTLGPADITVAFAVHDHLWHRRDGWLIGGPGGADGDICNPCGGGGRDKAPLTTTLPGGEVYTGPRHDLCLRGDPRGGWGRNCPCTHDRPHMRGVKPGVRDAAAQVAEIQQRVADSHRRAPALPDIPIPTANYLFTIEEFNGEGDDE